MPPSNNRSRQSVSQDGVQKVFLYWLIFWWALAVIAVGTPDWHIGDDGRYKMQWGIIQIVNNTNAQEIKNMFGLSPQHRKCCDSALAFGLLALLAGLASIRACYNHINGIGVDVFSGFVNPTLEQACYLHAWAGLGMIGAASIYVGEFPTPIYATYHPIRGFSFQIACVAGTALSISGYFSFFAFQVSPLPPWLAALTNLNYEREKQKIHSILTGFFSLILVQLSLADRYWKISPGSDYKDRVGLTMLWMNGTSYLVQDLVAGEGAGFINEHIKSASNFILSFGIIVCLLLTVSTHTIFCVTTGLPPMGPFVQNSKEWGAVGQFVCGVMLLIMSYTYYKVTTVNHYPNEHVYPLVWGYCFQLIVICGFSCTYYGYKMLFLLEVFHPNCWTDPSVRPEWIKKLIPEVVIQIMDWINKKTDCSLSRHPDYPRVVAATLTLILFSLSLWQTMAPHWLEAEWASYGLLQMVYTNGTALYLFDDPFNFTRDADKVKYATAWTFFFDVVGLAGVFAALTSQILYFSGFERYCIEFWWAGLQIAGGCFIASSAIYENFTSIFQWDGAYMGWTYNLAIANGVLALLTGLYYKPVPTVVNEVYLTNIAEVPGPEMTPDPDAQRSASLPWEHENDDDVPSARPITRESTGAVKSFNGNDDDRPNPPRTRANEERLQQASGSRGRESGDDDSFRSPNRFRESEGSPGDQERGRRDRNTERGWDQARNMRKESPQRNAGVPRRGW